MIWQMYIFWTASLYTSILLQNVCNINRTVYFFEKICLHMCCNETWSLERMQEGHVIAALLARILLDSCGRILIFRNAFTSWLIFHSSFTSMNLCWYCKIRPPENYSLGYFWSGKTHPPTQSSSWFFNVII